MEKSQASAVPRHDWLGPLSFKKVPPSLSLSRRVAGTSAAGFLLLAFCPLPAATRGARSEKRGPCSDASSRPSTITTPRASIAKVSLRRPRNRPQFIRPIRSDPLALRPGRLRSPFGVPSPALARPLLLVPGQTPEPSTPFLVVATFCTRRTPHITQVCTLKEKSGRSCIEHLLAVCAPCWAPQEDGVTPAPPQWVQWGGVTHPAGSGWDLDDGSKPSVLQ